ncbi:MAG: response regulator [Nitrospirota bacterium]
MAEQVDGAEVAEKKKKFVLVVDNNARDSFQAGMMLQNFGYSVTTVKTAEEALEFISIAVPALIVMELVLPGMNGVDLLTRIRKEPSLVKIPIIVQTSIPDIKVQDRCYEAGCTLYLNKPVDAESLYRAVQESLERTPRKNVRIPTFLKASVDGGGIGAEFVTVISSMGMFVKTLHPQPKGTIHGVSFILSKKIIKVEAQVLYSYGFGEGPSKDPGMGMKFITISSEDQALIQAYIQENIDPAAASTSPR